MRVANEIHADLISRQVVDSACRLDSGGLWSPIGAVEVVELKVPLLIADLCKRGGRCTELWQNDRRIVFMIWIEF